MENTCALTQKIDTLSESLVLKEQEISDKNLRIRILEEELARYKKQKFGASSEKLSPDQLHLFDEAEVVSNDDAEGVDSQAVPETIDVPAHQRRARKRPSIPADLPRIDVIHDLSDAEKICPHDGTALKQIGSEIHEQLDIIPATMQVLKHIRLTYACPCCEQHLITARKPNQAIEKSIASASVLATIATQKYVDGLPLYRQVALFKRIGIELDTTTLANWMIKCGALSQPLIALILENMLAQQYLHMDETTVQVLREADRDPQTQSYMWVLRSTHSAPAVLFHYAPSRSGSIPSALLKDYQGALMVDGYEGYNAICQRQSLVRLGCWAHARRKFVEAQAAQVKGKIGKADEVLSQIQKLYVIEKTLKDKSTAEKYAIRQHESQPILAKIKRWLDKSLPNVPPKTALGKALWYLHNQWSRLIGYVTHGDYPIDNNPAENAIRPFVIGRKNWMFAVSPKGASASANLYSLIETAKANGLEPFAYLLKVFTELPNAKCAAEVEALLPWNCKGGVG